jgi:plasmid stabilization system protein ParE
MIAGDVGCLQSLVQFKYLFRTSVGLIHLNAERLLTFKQRVFFHRERGRSVGVIESLSFVH